MFQKLAYQVTKLQNYEINVRVAHIFTRLFCCKMQMQIHTRLNLHTLGHHKLDI